MRVENAARFKADIPGSTLAVIEESGHSPHLEQPERTAELIVDFVLAEVDRSWVSSELERVV